MKNTAKSYTDLVAEALQEVDEVFPWDLEDLLGRQPQTMVLDVREPDEYDGVFLQGSLSVPRGILEQACEWDYAETVPELAKARQRPIIVVCRSGHRSALAAQTLKRMGYENVLSLKTGIKGCNDADIGLINKAGETVDPDWADEFLNPPIASEKLSKNHVG